MYLVVNFGGFLCGKNLALKLVKLDKIYCYTTHQFAGSQGFMYFVEIDIVQDEAK